MLQYLTVPWKRTGSKKATVPDSPLEEDRAL
jgi:hypothetical protein